MHITVGVDPESELSNYAAELFLTTVTNCSAMSSGRLVNLAVH